MNSSSLYLLAVLSVLVVAVITAVVTLLLAFKKNKAAVDAAPASKIDALPYDPTSSPEINTLVDSVIKLWSLETKLKRPGQQISPDETHEIQAEVERLKQLLHENGMYYFDPTGQYYSAANYMEVVSVQDGANPEVRGTSLVIAESPAVVRRGVLIRKAKVNIVAR